MSPVAHAHSRCCGCTVFCLPTSFHFRPHFLPVYPIYPSSTWSSASSAYLSSYVDAHILIHIFNISDPDTHPFFKLPLSPSCNKDEDKSKLHTTTYIHDTQSRAKSSHDKNKRPSDGHCDQDSCKTRLIVAYNLTVLNINQYTIHLAL
jgi:hypothetical protein